MIEIRGIKINVEKYTKVELERQICKKLRLSFTPEYKIIKRSIDARKKPDIFYVFNVGVFSGNEKKILNKINDNNIMSTQEVKYQFPKSGGRKLKHHPLIIGAGPAGLFCALVLAKMGYYPIIAEQGSMVSKRLEKVEEFWKTGKLDKYSNVQFGEGGAGTFSDGKLNTQVKDKYGRISFVLEEFVKHGADDEILFDNKPHVGTDCLINVVTGIRKEIEGYGGVFLFDTKAEDFLIEDGQIKSVKLLQNGFETWVDCSVVILAIGHSSRDTFKVLHEKNLYMEPKDFAVGVRVEHKAALIQQAMYGEGKAASMLPAAPYKLTYQTEGGRAVYSFCMCPGGYVVNASSDAGQLAVNGMSYSGRKGDNSNSAIVVNVKASDYMKDNDNPLSGIDFQRDIEKKAYDLCGGKIPVQRFSDFVKDESTSELGSIKPETKGEYALSNVRSCFPEFVSEAIFEGMYDFDKKIEGFAGPDTLLLAAETRTSSPVRIRRDDNFVANIEGIYPCGEGAGYAGGIVSAAVDGIKVAEAIVKIYANR